jgi:hypothetical protein
MRPLLKMESCSHVHDIKPQLHDMPRAYIIMSKQILRMEYQWSDLDHQGVSEHLK